MHTADFEEIGKFYQELLKYKNRRPNFKLNGVMLKVYPNLKWKQFIPKIKVYNFFVDNPSIGITVINMIGNCEYSIYGSNIQESPSFNVTKGVIFTVVIRDKNGCSNVTFQAHIVTYPKFFTPNNDGYNDMGNSGIST